MRIIRGNGGQATVFTHTSLSKVELIVKDETGESVMFLTPHRARRLADFLYDAAERAEANEPDKIETKDDGETV
jgi:hypothetical protein